MSNSINPGVKVLGVILILFGLYAFLVTLDIVTGGGVGPLSTVAKAGPFEAGTDNPALEPAIFPFIIGCVCVGVGATILTGRPLGGLLGR